MPVRPNLMKQKLRQGQPVFGGLLRTPEPTMIEVLGYAGYDYVVLDAEHGAHSFEALDTLILTAFASQVTPIVRVNDNTPGLIMRVLDIGAQGVLVPHIKNADDARRAVSLPPSARQMVHAASVRTVALNSEPFPGTNTSSRSTKKWQ
jgi:2-keto-3-deoxy-L-rhamnonate aldolase RhmA